MTRHKQFKARDIELLKAIFEQRVTGYNHGTWKATFRLEDGTICTRALLDYERRGLVHINRTNTSRFEIVLTEAGRELALKYRAQPFIYQ